MHSLVKVGKFQNESRLINYLVDSYAQRYGNNSTKLNELQADITSLIPDENLKIDKNGNFKIVKPMKLSQKINIEKLQDIRQKNKTYGQEKREVEKEYEDAKEKGLTNKTIEEYIETQATHNKIDEALTGIYDYLRSGREEFKVECERVIEIMQENRLKEDSDINYLFEVSALIR